MAVSTIATTRSKPRLRVRPPARQRTRTTISRRIAALHRDETGSVDPLVFITVSLVGVAALAAAAYGVRNVIRSGKEQSALEARLRACHDGVALIRETQADLQRWLTEPTFDPAFCDDLAEKRILQMRVDRILGMISHGHLSWGHITNTVSKIEIVSTDHPSHYDQRERLCMVLKTLYARDPNDAIIFLNRVNKKKSAVATIIFTYKGERGLNQPDKIILWDSVDISVRQTVARTGVRM